MQEIINVYGIFILCLRNNYFACESKQKYYLDIYYYESIYLKQHILAAIMKEKSYVVYKMVLRTKC